MSAARKILQALDQSLPAWPPYSDPSSAPTTFSDNTAVNFAISGIGFDGTDMIDAESNPVTETNNIRIHDGVSTTIDSTFAGPETGNRVYRLTMIEDDLGSVEGNTTGSVTFRVHSGVTSSISSSFSVDLGSQFGSGTIQDVCYNGRDIVFAYSGTSDYIVVMGGVSGNVKNFRDVGSDVSGGTQIRGIAWIGDGYLTSTDTVSSNGMTTYFHDNGFVLGVDQQFAEPAGVTKVLTWGGTNFYMSTDPDFSIRAIP